MAKRHVEGAAAMVSLISEHQDLNLSSFLRLLLHRFMYVLDVWDPAVFLQCGGSVEAGIGELCCADPSKT